MSSITCSQCGLVNFLSAEHCKRCKTTLSAPPPDKPLPNLSAPPADKPRPTLSKGLAQYAGNSERELPYLTLTEVTELVITEPAPRIWAAPLRILVVVLLVLGASWYQIQKWDDERAAQLKADKKIDQKIGAELDKAYRANHPFF